MVVFFSPPLLALLERQSALPLRDDVAGSPEGWNDRMRQASGAGWGKQSRQARRGQGLFRAAPSQVGGPSVVGRSGVPSAQSFSPLRREEVGAVSTHGAGVMHGRWEMGTGGGGIFLAQLERGDPISFLGMGGSTLTDAGRLSLALGLAASHEAAGVGGRWHWHEHWQ